MRILTRRDALRRRLKRSVVTVGVFDGVHRAHQRLILATVRMARRLRGKSIVVTFDPDPQTVLDPRHVQPTLMPLEMRLMHLRALGVDLIWVIPFTKRFARTSAEEFVRKFLIGSLRASVLLVGETFAFGCNRQGNMQMLRAIGSAHGMRIMPLREVLSEGSPISSSRIRRLIGEGRLSAAKKLLGHFPALYGDVVQGSGRGRLLGFPTANVLLRSYVLPPQGVYAVRVHAFDRAHVRLGKPAHFVGNGVMNLGVRPTFGPGPAVCEVHIMGFSGKLLGRSLILSLLKRLRDERRFPDAQALAAQIRRDILQARLHFPAS